MNHFPDRYFEDTCYRLGLDDHTSEDEPEEPVYHPMSKEWRSSTQAAAVMGYDRPDFGSLESVPEHHAILARFQAHDGRAIYCGFSRAWNCYIFRWVRKEEHVRL